MNASSRPATASEIIEILGHLDDVVIARIQATGATPAKYSKVSPGPQPMTRSAPNWVTAGRVLLVQFTKS